ncbi:MAG: PKD domain-containing protein [Bacteroidia bacterium]|nr:PKD domain-containing protein [Bacteroidia bacterium]
MSGITKPAFTMLSNNPACNNTYDGQINIEVTGAGTPLNYLLDNNLIQHHGQFNNINAGTHHLRVNGFDGCLFLDSTLVLASEADTTFSAFEVTLAGNELTCTNLSSGSPASLKWNFGDGDSSLLEHPLHNYTAPGTYQVCLSIETSCGTKDTCTAIVVELVQIAEIRHNAALKLYPVPTSNKITIEYSVKKKNTPYKIIDFSGRVIDRGGLQATPATLSLNLLPGFYSLQLEGEEARPFVVQ